MECVGVYVGGYGMAVSQCGASVRLQGCLGKKEECGEPVRLSGHDDEWSV